MEHKKKKVKQLSGGQKQLMNIMLAFVGKPTLLILDEITTGLDIRMQERILKFIRKYVDVNKTTLIIVSHITNEIDSLVDKMIIMEDGKFRRPKTLKEINEQYGSTQKYLRKYFGGVR
jgi:ABC-2 type transport system ATP-binding protein